MSLGSTRATVMAAAVVGLALLAGCSSTSGTPERANSSAGLTSSVTDATGSTTRTLPDQPSDSGAPSGSDTSSSLPTTTGAPTTGSTGASSTTSSSAPVTTVDEPRCTFANLDVTLESGGAAAGSAYYDIVFSNTGNDACSLYGFPEVEYVTGDSGEQVGAEAMHLGDQGVPVVVQPGESTSAQLQEVAVLNFPKDVCDPVPVRGLRVYAPGSDKAAFLPQENRLGCQKDSLPGGQFQLSVKAVGVGTAS